MQVDRFADKYPSLTPYHYAANNPLRFIDVNGDTIYVSEAMANSEALQKYAKTKEGYNYLSQFAYEGQTIVINGQEFTFANAGDYGNQNLKFMGYMDEYEGLTVPVTSIGGLELRDYVGITGTQSFEIYLGSNMSLGNQMDAIFHEVQHSFMFASGGFRGYTGRGTPTIAGFHHGAMMQGSLWIDHANFVTKANRRFNTNINIDEIWINTLWNALPGQIKEKVAAHKKVRY